VFPSEYLTGVAYHTFDLATVRYNSLQALDLMQQSGKCFDLYIKRSTATKKLD
jgi:hypothetical protein